MAINFPTSPTTNDIWTENDRSWKFNGTSWDGLPIPDASLDLVAGSYAEMEALAASSGQLCIVSDPDTGGLFEFDSTLVGADDQITNVSGWIRINGYDSDIVINVSNTAELDAAYTIVATTPYEMNSWSIVLDAGTYTPATELLFDNQTIKLSTSSGLATLDFTALTEVFGVKGINSAKIVATNIKVINAHYSGFQVDQTSRLAANSCESNLNGWRGFEAKNHAEMVLTDCISNNNNLSGVECLLNGSAVIYNHVSDGNGWAGYTSTNSSNIYVNGSTADLNTRYGFECAGSSLLYGRDLDVTNGSATAAAYLSSGSANMTLHTCTASNCSRPFMAEYAGVISGIAFSAVMPTPFAGYSAFYSEYGSDITIITTPALPTTITNFATAFEAKYGSKIVSNRPAYFNTTGVTTQSIPATGIFGNKGSLVDMDPFTGQEALASGTYTPTISDTTNVSASSINPSQYSRVENIITVSGSVSITPTSSPVDFTFNLSLPFPSNIGSYFQVAGSGMSYTYGGDPIAVNGDSATDKANFRGYANSAGAQIYLYTYQYQVL